MAKRTVMVGDRIFHKNDPDDVCVVTYVEPGGKSGNARSANGFLCCFLLGRNYWRIAAPKPAKSKRRKSKGGAK